MAEKKNQHFVPKVHLKQFSTDVRKKRVDIWLLKHDRIIHGASISDQCSKSYFYGKDLDVENFFNSPEGVFGSVVNRLVKTPVPTQDDLDTLLYLWLLQHVRAERTLTEQLMMMATMREKAALGQDDNEELQEFLGEPMGVDDAIKMALESTREYYGIISDLRSVLLVNNTKTGFIMSDNPAVSSNKLVLKRFKGHRNWGLNGAGVYVFVPLTPTIGFLAFDRYVYELVGRTGRTCVLSEKDVKALNQTVFLFSNHTVVLPPGTDYTSIVENLKMVSESKPVSTMRVNLAVKDDHQGEQGSSRFSVASDNEFETASDGLIHIESVPPIVPTHLPRLRIRQSPRFIDTKSGAGLRRFGAVSRY